MPLLPALPHILPCLCSDSLIAVRLMMSRLSSEATEAALHATLGEARGQGRVRQARR